MSVNHPSSLHAYSTEELAMGLSVTFHPPEGACGTAELAVRGPLF